MLVMWCLFFFFFFKQKTAYELRISDWSSDVCSSDLLLVIVTVVALAWANSPLSDAYFELWHLDVGFDFGTLGLHMDLHHWVNDGLMVVFFFLIGLEVRQEFDHGSVRDRSRARRALIGIGRGSWRGGGCQYV